MTTTLLFAFLMGSGAIGVTLIVANGKLFKPLRVWLKRGTGFRAWLGALVSCTMCFGFWVGLGLGALLHESLGLLPNPEFPYVVLVGGAVSLWSYVADLLLLKLEVGLGDELAIDPDMETACLPDAAGAPPTSATPSADATDPAA